jgi:O-antigen ligase
MSEKTHPFETETGSARIAKPGYVALILCIVSVSAWLIFRMEIIGTLAFILLPFFSVFVYFLFTYPILGLYTTLGYAFIVLGLGKYITGIPLGTLMDGILILTYVALFIGKFRERVDFSPANKDITILAILWFGYTLFELFNPEARSVSAWFSGRGVSLYMLLTVPLTLLFIDSNKKLNTFLYLWGILSLLATLKGVMQHFLGVDHWERAWLNEGNYKTHILFGKLRSFSFMSDAGQFGANQAYSAVVAFIVSLSFKDLRKKLFFLIIAVAGLYGMVISGTRGAMSVPIVGLAVFFVLRKNIRVLITGAIVLMAVIGFFKFTSIGQGNAQIRRMRTAFDPNDASLMVRLDNQRKLRAYLATRPFGGGIGHAGVKAQRFLPDAFLSSVPTDSGYVLVWAEMGIVGLLLLLFILFWVLIKSCYRIMFRIRDPMLKLKFAALASGMAGIMVANYGNAVLGQMPTNMLIYISMALLMNSELFDKEVITKNIE